jgi:hypothetical protein
VPTGLTVNKHRETYPSGNLEVELTQPRVAWRSQPLTGEQMSSKPTGFIIGAGASAEFGMPLGSGLKTVIALGIGTGSTRGQGGVRAIQNRRKARHVPGHLE